MLPEITTSTALTSLNYKIFLLCHLRVEKKFEKIPTLTYSVKYV